MTRILNHKLTRQILSLIKEYFFRRKTLNYIIWFVIVTIIADLRAIGTKELIDEFIDKLNEDFQNQFIDYISIFLRYILIDGSYLVLCVLILILTILFYLKHQEIINNRKNDYDDSLKRETLLRVINQIRKSKVIDESTFILITQVIKDQKIINNLNAYYGFERRRGNVTTLENFVKESNLIEELTKIINNEL